MKSTSFIMLAALTLVSGAAAAAAAPGIYAVEPNTPLTETGAYPSEARVGSFDGAFKREKAYTSQSNPEHVIGFWESGPGAMTTDSYPIDEYCLIMMGTLVLTDADGTSRTFNPGDSFIIPKGWAGTWDMKSHFKKQFVTF